MNLSTLDDLVRVCRNWGQERLLIQGPGGNFSLKIDRQLWIKSSGALLKDVTPYSGLTGVSLDRFQSFNTTFEGPTPSPSDEDRYIQALKESQANPILPRPSMETGFHAIIPESWVLHVHSIAGIIWGLTSASPEFAGMKEWMIRQEVTWAMIEPCIPGLQLTGLIRSALAKVGESRILLLVLKNHGLVWASNDISRLELVASQFETELRLKWNLKEFSLPNWEAPSTLNFSNWKRFSFELKPIFPDVCVFFPDLRNQIEIKDRKVIIHTTFSEQKREWIREILFAHAMVNTLTRELGVYRPLPEEICSIISQLEIEKLRIGNS